MKANAVLVVPRAANQNLSLVEQWIKHPASPQML